MLPEMFVQCTLMLFAFFVKSENQMCWTVTLEENVY